MSVRRVAYVVNVFPKLSETFIAGELAELGRRGVELRILSLNAPNERLRHRVVAAAGLEERAHYDPDRFLEELEDFAPELLHAHFATEPTDAARRLSAELGIPFTFTTHGYDVYRRPPADLAARARAAAAVLTVSHANARQLAATTGLAESFFHVVPAGIDLDRFRPAGRRAERAHIVCVARLKPVKNLALLLEACANLRRRGLDFRCTIVGDGPLRDELVARRRELNLDGIVHLAGAAEQDEVLRWWQSATIAVLPSTSEGMPVCLMEAAACALPAVATAVGGVPELVQDGRTGLLARPGDAAALADGLERLLRSPTWASRLGAAARRHALERFSLGTQVDRLLAIWDRVRSAGAARKAAA